MAVFRPYGFSEDGVAKIYDDTDEILGVAGSSIMGGTVVVVDYNHPDVNDLPDGGVYDLKTPFSNLHFAHAALPPEGGTILVLSLADSVSGSEFDYEVSITKPVTIRGMLTPAFNTEVPLNASEYYLPTAPSVPSKLEGYVTVKAYGSYLHIENLQIDNLWAYQSTGNFQIHLDKVHVRSLVRYGYMSSSSVLSIKDSYISGGIAYDTTTGVGTVNIINSCIAPGVSPISLHASKVNIQRSVLLSLYIATTATTPYLSVDNSTFTTALGRHEDGFSSVVSTGACIQVSGGTTLLYKIFNSNFFYSSYEDSSSIRHSAALSGLNKTYRAFAGNTYTTALIVTQGTIYGPSGNAD